MENLCLTIVLGPLLGAIIAGLFGKQIGRIGAHTVTIGAVGLSALLSIVVLSRLLIGTYEPLEVNIYTWASVGDYSFHIGFLIDRLTALMMVVVSFVSLMVHIYTIGYMQDDPGYQRFFSYIALFTFSMLMLVTSNNFLQLFFGWEAVGLASYLLIGFWFTRETAIFANLKAFLVNRIGDFGFLLGIAAVLYYFKSLDYNTVFAAAANLDPTTQLAVTSTISWPVFDVIGILLFIGAMGKSAQVPLHVWLPDSMEGPTPISALIHAATMVTAGVFMLARMSPIFEHAEIARSVVLVIGATTCFFMGLIGVVSNDIKRIIAYSTLSQLGYMIMAQGVSAYEIGMFHLMTHAFFKALLFLGAGSVIIAMHHEQDIWKMGGLRNYMPITYGTMVIGTLALIGFPFFSGFYSKDFIIEAIHASTIPGSDLAYWAALSSVFVTSLYSFRLLFVVFHTKERMDERTRSHLHETPPVVWVPLVFLAVPSVLAGALFAGAIFDGYFGQSIVVHPEHNVVGILESHYHGWMSFGFHGFLTMPFGLALAGALTAWFCYEYRPEVSDKIRRSFRFFHWILQEKYGFDAFNQGVVASGTRCVAGICAKLGDRAFIDGLIVNGSARTVGKIASIARGIQSGYLYHYAFTMFVGLLIFFWWLLNL